MKSRGDVKGQTFFVDAKDLEERPVKPPSLTITEANYPIYRKVHAAGARGITAKEIAEAMTRENADRAKNRARGIDPEPKRADANLKVSPVLKRLWLDGLVEKTGEVRDGSPVYRAREL